MEVSTKEIAHALKDLQFPTSKGYLLQLAGQHHAPEHIMLILEGLPDMEYHSMTDLWDVIGEMSGQGEL
jgi:hypothetical protein